MKNIISFLVISTSLQSQLKFSNLDSLLSFADKQSSQTRIALQQSLLAKWTRVAALANTINFRNPVSFSATDNILLPVNFIPGEVFGGPAGSVKPITLGQQYVTNFNFNPQIDIINPANWARVQSANASMEFTELNNLLTKKMQYESIAAAFYNVTSLQQQKVLTERFLISSDSISTIIQNKYEAGIARQQDLNNAAVNKINVEEKLNQINISIQQQTNSMKILCDIPNGKELIIEGENIPEIEAKTILSKSNLSSKLLVSQSYLARSELKANRFSMLPVVSLFYYQGWQKNSNNSFQDNNSKWIQSKFIGFRITVPFPPDATKFSQTFSAKINRNISELNFTHGTLQNELNNQNLDLDLEKAKMSFSNAQKISNLKKVNYGKSLNQFNEGIIPAEILLTSFNDLISAQLNEASARASLQFYYSKISIGNNLK